MGVTKKNKDVDIGFVLVMIVFLIGAVSTYNILFISVGKVSVSFVSFIFAVLFTVGSFFVHLWNLLYELGFDVS